ncbi:MAG: hypothetical protein F6K58_03580 [Symploca sp. SIO2E9]|nr:hypothetical protein [Symploca sp. SIO2E9]
MGRWGENFDQLLLSALCLGSLSRNSRNCNLDAQQLIKEELNTKLLGI